MEKPASVLEAENASMAKTITNFYMKHLSCKDISDLIQTCETIISAAKSCISK